MTHKEAQQLKKGQIIYERDHNIVATWIVTRGDNRNDSYYVEVLLENKNWSSILNQIGLHTHYLSQKECIEDVKSLGYTPIIRDFNGTNITKDVLKKKK